MRYVYGPVPSRRLGRSLGIDPIPLKTCNYQCIYCQLGRTTNFTNERKNFVPSSEIIDEMETAIKLKENEFDYITFVGSGEPLLYKDLDRLVIKAKELSDKPVSIITNGSLLFKPEIQDFINYADVVLPSLDAGDESTFIKINRPHPNLKYSQIIDGLVKLRDSFSGEIWIEIMLIKDINDTADQLTKIKNAIDLIKPNRIDINIPLRPPSEEWVKIPEKKVITLLKQIFGKYSSIMKFPKKSIFSIYSQDFEKELLAIIKRHPMRERQIIKTFKSDEFTKADIIHNLELLKQRKKILKINYQDETFWKSNL